MVWGIHLIQFPPSLDTSNRRHWSFSFKIFDFKFRIQKLLLEVHTLMNSPAHSKELVYNPLHSNQALWDHRGPTLAHELSPDLEHALHSFNRLGNLTGPFRASGSSEMDWDQLYRWIGNEPQETTREGPSRESDHGKKRKPGLRGGPRLHLPAGHDKCTWNVSSLLFPG